MVSDRQQSPPTTIHLVVELHETATEKLLPLLRVAKMFGMAASLSAVVGMIAIVIRIWTMDA